MSRLTRAAVLVRRARGARRPVERLADNYVALGDSYSSGVGTNSYTLNSALPARRLRLPLPRLQQRPNTSLNFVACSGATTTSA